MRKMTIAALLGAIAVLALTLAGPAAAKDRNHDKIPDKWEKRYNLSLKKKQGKRDQDKDGAKNRAEYKAKTSPREADTDGDGTPDGYENSGTIESFDAATGVLVIDLYGGDTVTGTVDDQTQIECGCHGDSDTTGDDDTGDNSSSLAADDDPGDDDGNQGPPPPPDGQQGPPPPGHDGPGDDGSDSTCTTDDLVVGAVVHQAELKTTADGIVFTDVQLVKQDPAAAGS